MWNSFVYNSVFNSLVFISSNHMLNIWKRLIEACTKFCLEVSGVCVCVNKKRTKKQLTLDTYAIYPHEQIKQNRDLPTKRFQCLRNSKRTRSNIHYPRDIYRILVDCWSDLNVFVAFLRIVKCSWLMLFSLCSIFVDVNILKLTINREHKYTCHVFSFWLMWWHNGY